MEGKKKKSDRLRTVLLFVVFIIGLSLLLYPTVANYWNSMHQTHAITRYSESVAQMDDDKFAEMWEAAYRYNATVPPRITRGVLSEEDQLLYNETLNMGGSGVMGYIEIPEIDVSLPIYHGTSEGVLQVAVGHLDWSSLPTGGEGTHCVLSGHRGLPSAKLFTQLDQLVEGDVFMLRVLDEILTYEVDQILIVEPQDTSALGIVPNADLCTLVTCTPYGINTHRLLVRGHRIENAEEAKSVTITSEMIQVDQMIVATVLACPVLLLLLLLVFLPSGGNSSAKVRKSISADQRIVVTKTKKGKVNRVNRRR